MRIPAVIHHVVGYPITYNCPCAYQSEISKVEVHRKQKDRGHPKTRNGKATKEGARCKFTKCKRRNHFAVVCRAGRSGAHGKQSRVSAVREEDSSESERFLQYTFGKVTVIQSDHKPLESLMQKPLSKAPRRLQGMMMRLMKYNTEIFYTKGTNMCIANMLSRAFLKERLEFGAVRP